MGPRGIGISRAAAVALAACLFAAASPLPGWAASHSPRAGVAKKCKKRRHHRKKRHCKRRAAPAAATLTISPASQDFGVIAVGGTTRTFSLSNAGAAPSGVPTAAISGPEAGTFSIAGSTCMSALPPAGSCQIDVHLDFVEPLGVHSGMLSVTAVPGGTVTAAMTGDVEI